MLLPGGDKAIVDVRKLESYILNPLHPRGRHKARVFAAALGIQQSDADMLQQQLVEVAATQEADLGECDAYGQRYIVDFEWVIKNRRAVIRSSWIVMTGEDVPRLTTCYVESD